MDDPDGGRGEPVPTLFYGLLPKPQPAAPPPDAEWEADGPRPDGAERDREPRWA